MRTGSFESIIGTKGQRHKLCALANLAKYLNRYSQFKEQMHNAGLHWNNNDSAFKGFLSIFSKNHNDVPKYLEDIWTALNWNEQIFVKFLAITGLRAGEGIDSFNLIIELNDKGRLGEYYNKESCVLEHFKYKELFLRKTKNTFISFVSPQFIEEICNASPVNYNIIQCRLKRLNKSLRFKELRSFNNTFIRKHNVLGELVDILAGRVPKSVFVRHYLGADMDELSKQVLMIQESLVEVLFGF
ncbi:integrase [Candidatus Bathycorpusculum sp.]|uniref:integrase n=1 Tax=Candidatus Bathycorpusculum sp. TaxID=2994959 RepID=UPI002820EC5F|nr:hypothetical protein [Candidatus Termitimicrobium sp.]MCL2685198.1 hypothetical protein [Candidatus Termitimicrobium sp.]